MVLRDDHMTDLLLDPVSSKILKFWLIVEGILTLVGLVLLLSLSNSASVLLFIILLAVILSMITGIIVISRYGSISVVRNQRACLLERMRLLDELDKSKKSLDRIGRAIADIEMAHLEEIDLTLRVIQQNFIQTGLKAAVVYQIEEIAPGRELSAKLKACGIYTAEDIGKFIKKIDQFGLSEAVVILNWKDSVLSQLEATKPGRLTDEQLNKIRLKFKRQWVNLNKSRQAFHVQSSKLELELNATDRYLSQFTEVSLVNFLCLNLLGPMASRRLKKAGPAIVLSLLGAGAIFHFALGAISGGALLMAAISPPAPLPSPSIVFTPSPTFTAPRPPTHTPTSTKTGTPKQTSTPTSTSVPSMTPSPTRDSSFYAVADCLPRDTLVQEGTVVLVEDGDTIQVHLEDGNTVQVRYLGINAPETGRPFAAESSGANSDMVLDQHVILIRDISDVDAYGRLLRYVIASGSFVNLKLVEVGLAQAQAYPPDTACSDVFSRAEDEARLGMAGMWTATQTPVPSAPQVVIIAVDKRAEYVDIQNIGPGEVDLSGWILVSEKGNQECPLSGRLASGEVLRIWSMAAQAGDFSCGYNSPIWNNSEPDPAVLYNPQGVEVSRK